MKFSNTLTASGKQELTKRDFSEKMKKGDLTQEYEKNGVDQATPS